MSLSFILGSRDSDYYLHPRMILAKDVPYCMLIMNNMTVKERIFVMENKWSLLYGGRVQNNLSVISL
jgi:hypothetical protein